jgi:3-oxoacyl-[acyl-carrier-protein] synthase-3
MLFGDGASAWIVSEADSSRKALVLQVIDVLLQTNGQYVDDLGIRCPGTEFGNVNTHSVSEYANDYAPTMNGQSVILQASRRIVASCKAILERNNLTANDVRWIVPHQANANLLAQVARGLGLPSNDDRVISVLAETGKTSSASMGIALNALRRSNRIAVGDLLLLPAFAAGFTWGAALCRAME